MVVSSSICMDCEIRPAPVMQRRRKPPYKATGLSQENIILLVVLSFLKCTCWKSKWGKIVGVVRPWRERVRNAERYVLFKNIFL